MCIPIIEREKPIGAIMHQKDRDRRHPTDRDRWVLSIQSIHWIVERRRQFKGGDRARRKLHRRPKIDLFGVSFSGAHAKHDRYAN